MKSLSSSASEWRSSWGVSLAVHAAFGIFILLLFIPWSRKETVDFEVYEQPKVATQAAIQLSKPVPPKATTPEKRAVFGASRKAIMDSTGDPNAAAVKAGNTVAKTPDSEKLRDDDADSIPIPVEEYLVTAMPILESEFRIPYPPEAKKARVQGRVVMDLLIDSEGKVRQASLVEGPGYGLNEAALQAIQNFKFRPAKIQDRVVAVKIRYAYNFVLER